MAQHDVLILNESVPQLQEPQAGDSYRMPADVEIVGNLTISGTVDGADVAATAALAASATQPGDNLSTLVNDILASQAEAEAGSNNTKMMTPLRVAQAIAILAAGIKNNLSATVAPTATDDENSGYSAGSFWIDTVADESYRCVDPSANVAVWVRTTLQASDLATVATSGDSDDLIEGSVNLLMTVAERAALTELTSITTGITAFAGGGQASATLLTTRYNLVETVASPGDSVKLPVTTGGTMVLVKNTGANACDVFPQSGVSINKLAADAAFSVAADSTTWFYSVSATQWETL